MDPEVRTVRIAHCPSSAHHSIISNLEREGYVLQECTSDNDLVFSVGASHQTGDVLVTLLYAGVPIPGFGEEPHTHHPEREA